MYNINIYILNNIYIYMCVYIYICVHILHIYIYIYIHIHKRELIFLNFLYSRIFQE